MVDYLEVQFDSEEKPERFCGEQEVQLAPKFGRGEAKIRVVSNNRNSMKGFQLRYQVTPNDVCRSSPCLNGGLCVTLATGFECNCQAGTSGDYCQVIDDPCFSNPCLNGGTCTQVGDSYSCACTENYQGTNCDRLITSTSTTSTTTTRATTESGTTETDREGPTGPTGAPQPPFANISVQDFFGQSCDLSEEGKKMMEGWIESYRKWELLFADYQETYKKWKNDECS